MLAPVLQYRPFLGLRSDLERLKLLEDFSSTTMSGQT